MANNKISDYTEKIALDTTDLFLVEQAAGTYRNATSTAIKQTAGMISNNDSTGSVTNTDLYNVIGSGTSTASGPYSSIIGSSGSTAGGPYSSIIGSSDSTASGTGASVIGGDTNMASGTYFPFIAGSQSSTANGTYGSNILGSTRIINSVIFSLAMGYAASGSASTANRKIHLFGETGNVSIAGTLSSSVTFTDFAEMFKNNQGEEIEAGYIVTLDGDGVRIATEGDDISGVVSYTAVVLAGDSPILLGWTLFI